MTTFNTYDYDFLLRSLVDGSAVFKLESIKRLVSLAQNDKKQFMVYCKSILNGLEGLYTEEKEQINQNCINLLAEIIESYNSSQIQSMIEKGHLPYLVRNLGHETKPSIRKNSHTSLLGYLKTYANFDNLCEVYLTCGFTNNNQLVRQKSINSFQSILILQIKQYNWHSETSKQVLENLLSKIGDSNASIAKAATQCILTLSKFQGIKIVVSKLGLANAEKMRSFLMQWISKSNTDTLAIKPKQIQQMMSQTIRKAVQLKQKSQLQNKQENMQLVKNNSTNRRLQKIRSSLRNQQKKQNQKQVVPHNKLFSNFTIDGSIKDRTQAAEDLLYRIQINSHKLEFQSSTKAILPNVLKMLKDPNPKIVGLTLRILQSIITHLRSQDPSLNNLMTLIVEKLGDQKISIRQMVSKVIRQIIKKTDKGRWIRQLLGNLRKNVGNNFLKDQTLSLILHIFQESPIDQIQCNISDLLSEIASFTDDPKTKIKIRALDCLAIIVLKYQQFEKYNTILKGKMSQIFYQMYQQKLNRLLQQHQKKLINDQKRKKIQQVSNSCRTTFNLQKQNPQQQNLNVSIDVIRKRVSHLRKPRNLLSTQETNSLDNSTHKYDRIEDVELMLPRLEQNTRTNRFLKRIDYSPNKTEDHNKGSDYLSKQDLKPMREPQKQLKNVLGDLKSTDWKILFEATNKIRRIVQYNPQLILSANPHSLILDILGMIESLRSSVAKNGLICLGQLMVAMNRQVDSEIQVILEKLLRKSADTNVFISSQVQKCLKILSQNASSNKILDKIMQFRENKTIAIKDSCINVLVHMKDIQKVREKQYVKLAESIGYYMMEGQQQIRKKAKMGVIDLCKSLGDWYRSLRGKVNQSCFKSICELMTKPNNIKNMQTMQLQSVPSINPSTQNISSKTIEVERKVRRVRDLSTSNDNVMTARKITKLTQFPIQFNQIQSLLEFSNSSDWRKRMESLENVKKIALEHPHQFSQHRSANHLIDIICKQLQQPNIKVSMRAMQAFLEIETPLRGVVVNNLGVLSNSIFNNLSSNRVQIRQLAGRCSQVLLNEIDIETILQFLCHGILYSLPKSRIYLVIKLIQKFQSIYRNRKQLLFKHVFPLINKLMDEYRAQLMPHVVSLLQQIYKIMGNQMFSHLSKFKQIRQLISK